MEKLSNVKEQGVVKEVGEMNTIEYETTKKRNKIRVLKVSKLGAKFFLWRMNMLDKLHRLWTKKNVRNTEEFVLAENSEEVAAVQKDVQAEKFEKQGNKKEKKSAKERNEEKELISKEVNRRVRKQMKAQRSQLHNKAKQELKEVEEKVYSKYINKLLILLLNGIALGGLLLAGYDYLIGEQIPERNPIILGMLLLIVVCSGIYWYRQRRKSKGLHYMRYLATYAMLICFVGVVIGSYAMYKNVCNLRTYFMGETIVIKDKKKTAKQVAEYINIWRHTPNFCKAYVSDTLYYAIVYNSKGESITQLVSDAENTQEEKKESDKLSDIAICLKDGTAVIVSDTTIEHRKDVDNLRYVQLAYEWAAKGKANIERVSVSEDTIPKTSVVGDAMPGTEYVVLIKGLDNIKKFYSTVLSASDVDAMLKSLETVSEDLIELRFHVSINTAYLGVAAVISVDGEENLLWYIDNYVEVYDWTLGDYDWYTYDYLDAKQNEKMIESAMYNSTVMLEKFSDDLGIDSVTD